MMVMKFLQRGEEFTSKIKDFYENNVIGPFHRRAKCVLIEQYLEK